MEFVIQQMDFASASMDLLGITAKAPTFVITKIVQEMVFVNRLMELAFAIMDSQGIIVKILWTYVLKKIVQEMVFVIKDLAFASMDLSEKTVNAQTCVRTKIVQEMVFAIKELAFASMDLLEIIVIPQTCV